MTLVSISIFLFWMILFTVVAIILSTFFISGFTTTSIGLFVAILFIGILFNISMHIKSARNRFKVKKE